MKWFSFLLRHGLVVALVVGIAIAYVYRQQLFPRFFEQEADDITVAKESTEQSSTISDEVADTAKATTNVQDSAADEAAIVSDKAALPAPPAQDDVPSAIVADSQQGVIETAEQAAKITATDKPVIDSKAESPVIVDEAPSSKAVAITGEESSGKDSLPQQAASAQDAVGSAAADPAPQAPTAKQDTPTPGSMAKGMMQDPLKTMTGMVQQPGKAMAGMMEPSSPSSPQSTTDASKQQAQIPGAAPGQRPDMPVYAQQGPGPQTGMPAYGQQGPGPQTGMPAYGQQRPGPQTGMPTYGQQGPGPQTGMPAYGQQGPGPQTGMPAYGQQGPGPQTGMPAYGQQGPGPQTGMPAYGQQRPGPQSSMPAYGQRGPGPQPGMPTYGQQRPGSQTGMPAYRQQWPGRQPGMPAYGQQRPAPQTGAPAYRPGSRTQAGTPAQSAAVQPQHEYNQIINKARHAYWQGQYQDSVNYYQQAIKLKPDAPDAYGELGNVYYAQGEWNKSGENLYQSAIRLLDQGRSDKARNMLSIIRGLQHERAAELEKRLQAQGPAQ